MTQTTRMVIGCLTGLAIAATVNSQITAQGKGGGGKPKGPTSIPGEAWFRCNLGDLDGCDNGFGDGLIGDGSGYFGEGAGDAGGSGAHLNISNGEFWIGHVEWTVNFGLQRPTMCDGAGQPACRWPWPSDPNEPAILTLGLAEIQSNFINEFNEPVDGGLMALPVGESGLARFKMTTENPGFWLNFTFEDGSDAVKVTRTDDCTWVFTDVLDPDTGDRAMAILRSGTRKTLVMEGLFHLPFEMTFTAPGCIAG